MKVKHIKCGTVLNVKPEEFIKHRDVINVPKLELKEKHMKNLWKN